MNQVLSAVWAVAFWAFIIIKMMGAALASWSWWWIILPQVPTIYLVVAKAGLL